MAQDRLAHVIATSVVDFRVEKMAGALGPIHLVVDDPHALLMEDGEPARRPLAARKNERIRPAAPWLAGRARVLPDGTLGSGSPGFLVYGLCDPAAAGTRRNRKGEEAVPAFAGWELHRELSCGDDADPVPVRPGPLPQPPAGTGCIVVIDAVPEGVLPPGDCRFEVTLERPGSEPEVRTLDLRVEPVASAEASTPRRKFDQP